ncbi:MAG: hypothetical protein ACXABG_02815 [Promethearchaeota archaeon]|jgi:hypothetical protein
MKKSNKIIIGVSIPIILIGGGIGSFNLIGFLTYAAIEESYSFYYKPEISVEPEKFVVSIFSDDPREINIEYNTSSVPYFIKTDVYLKAEGIYMKNSNYSFFNAEWDNYSLGSVTELRVLTMPPTLGAFYHPTWTVKYDITVNISLRTDVLYDLEI